MENGLLEFLDIEKREDETDVEVEYNDNNDLSIKSRKLHTSRQDKAITDLHRMIKNGQIILSPTFQRKYVWSKKSASKFIESLLINIPIPTVFVSANCDGVWDVVDGQQRLTSILKFLDNELQLSDLESLTELNKKYYDDLDEKTKRLLDNRTLSVVIIDNDSSEDIKFDIFMRINQGSVKLNEQELRNCLYRGPFMESIKEMGTNENLLKILKQKDTFINRLQHLEVIERFLSIREIIDTNTFKLIDGSYSGSTTNTINVFLKKNQNVDNDTIASYEILFNDTIKKVFAVFGTQAFRQYVNGEYNYMINRSVAELQLVMCSFISNSDITKYKNKIKESFEKLMLGDNRFVDAFTHATNNISVVNYRYNIWGTALKEIIKNNE